MKRICLMVLRNILFAPIWFFKIWYYGRSDKYTEEQRFALLKHVTVHANKGGRVKIEVHGLENLPKENGYILFPNHQGLFDVLAFLEANPDPFTVVMKKEVQNVVLIKQVRIIMRAQAIDREDPRNAMKVIRQMAEEVKQGRNYLIFSEGTRTKNPNRTQEFKGGSFKSAYYAKGPIVPAVLIDSYKAFDVSSIKPLTVQLHYLAPLYYDDYKDMKTNEVAALVKQRIDAVISENEYLPIK